MTEKEKNITRKIKSKIAKKDPTAEVILFGSHARGQANADSDWDILILTGNPIMSRLMEREYRNEIFDIELEIGEAISTYVFSKKDWEEKHFITPLYANIKQEGIYI